MKNNFGSNKDVMFIIGDFYKTYHMKDTSLCII
jgi:hypothetical protein